MATIREESMAYVPQENLNIADLDKVNTELTLTDEEREDKEGVKYSVKLATIDGKKYRVPLVVLGQLKTVMSAKPEMTEFKVIKSGEGKQTKYTVIPLN